MTYTLRNYQAEAKDAALDAFRRKRNGIICLPTGSGKSLVIAAIADEIGGNVIVLQPTKEILEQNFWKLKSYSALGFDDLAICSASAGSKRAARITFATIGTIINRLHLFPDTDMVVIDECHLVNSDAGQYKSLIEHFGVPVIGLTASPYRMNSSMGGEVVEAKFLHRTRPRIFEEIIYIAQNVDLHEQGFLCPIQYNENPDYDPYVIRRNSTGMNYDERALSAYHQKHGVVDKLVKISLSNLDRVNHQLLFASSIHESKQINDALLARGVASAHIDGKTPKGQRECILNDFRSGQLKVVTNVGVLTTGFDFPELDAIILGRPTMSLPLYYQMVGRGVRCSDSKTVCHVFDVCGNVARFGRPDEYKIIAGDRSLHRLFSGSGPLTGVNFTTGRDMETERRKRAERRKTDAKMIATGEISMSFGRHKGTHIQEVPESYLRWGAENLQHPIWRKAFSEELGRREKYRELAS